MKMISLNPSADLRTLAVGAIGALAFALLGVPAAFLSGAILSCAAACIAGVRQQISKPLNNVSFLILGVAVGSSVSPESFLSLYQWPISLAALTVAMAILLLVLPRYFVSVHGLDLPTARLCGIPGAIAMVMALADDLPVDKKRVAVLQSFRLAMLMLMVPLFGSIGVVSGAGEQVSEPLLSTDQLLTVVLASASGAFFAWIARLPAPFLSGPMLGSGLVFALGLVDGQLPAPLIDAAFLVVGASIGARFNGVTRNYLKSCLNASLGGVAVAVTLTALIAWPVAVYLGIPFIQMWLAIAPGGFDAMVALSIALNADPAFVATHQFARLIGLFLIVPVLFRGMKA